MLNNMYTNYNGLMNLKDMLVNNKNVKVVYEEKAANVLNCDNVVNLRKANPVKVQKVEEPKEEVVEEVVIAEEPKEEVVEDNDNLVEDIMNELKEEGVINEEGQLINPKEEPKKEEVKVEEPKEEVVEDMVNKFNEVADKELNELVDKLVVENPKEEPKKVEVETKKTIKDKAIDSTINAVECMGKGCIEATKIVGVTSIAGGAIISLGGGILEAIKARKFQPIVTGLTALVSTFVGTVQSLIPIVVVGYGLKKLAKFIKKISDR